MRIAGGPFWVALARAARHELADDPTVAYPRRERKPVDRECYIDSTTAIIGSSSPTRPSSSEFEVDLDVDQSDEDEHDARGNKLEEITVHLAFCFLQQALNLCLLQCGAAEVCPRVERKQARASVAGVYNFSAEDDGGICQMEQHARGWRMVHPYLALLEAKRSFKYITVDGINDRKRIVSNGTLAQYLGEAVATWKANRELLGQE